MIKPKFIFIYIIINEINWKITLINRKHKCFVIVKKKISNRINIFVQLINSSVIKGIIFRFIKVVAQGILKFYLKIKYNKELICLYIVSKLKHS